MNPADKGRMTLNVMRFLCDYFPMIAVTAARSLRHIRAYMLSTVVIVMAAASSSTSTRPTKDEIIDMHARLEGLRLTMAERSAGGKSSSGRYKKHDTARKVYLDTVGIPGLRLGKLPPADDVRRLFLPGDDEITGPAKVEMDEFYKKYKKDPRSTSTESYGLDHAKQLTLLEWVSRNPGSFVRPSAAPRGAPPSYRLVLRVAHPSCVGRYLYLLSQYA